MLLYKSYQTACICFLQKTSTTGILQHLIKSSEASEDFTFLENIKVSIFTHLLSIRKDIVLDAGAEDGMINPLLGCWFIGVLISFLFSVQ